MTKTEIFRDPFTVYRLRATRAAFVPSPERHTGRHPARVALELDRARRFGRKGAKPAARPSC